MPVRGQVTITGGNHFDRKKAVPTTGDLLFAVERHKSRILERTLRGVDADEKPFAPYSEKGPYYYYPTGADGKRGTAKQQKSRVNRLLKKTQHVADYLFEQGSDSAGGVKTKSGRGIRYQSYADFKRSLGRAGVDLTGPKAPHMLQAILSEAGGVEGRGREPGLTQNEEPATSASLRIEGEAAKRAAGHNQGAKHLPQRQFLAIGREDQGEFVGDLLSRARERLR